MFFVGESLKIKTTDNNQDTKSEWTNFLEIRAFGLMRSGNHAIIDWIQNQFTGETTCFLNNIKHGNKDPYTNYEQKTLTGVDEQADIETLRTIKKRLLVYSYEDRHELEFDKNNFYESVFQAEYENNRQKYLGTSKHQFDILIIRDPFNFFASRMKLMQVRGPQGGVSDLKLIAKNWKVLATEAIKLTKEPQQGKIVASFNQWVTDLEYRRNLSQLFLGTFNDSSRKKTPEYGGGSSFSDTDKLTMHMIISKWRELFNIKRYARLGHYWKRFTAPDKEKNVLLRWQQFATYKKFRDLFLDKELLELSEKLFGEIPGTREFVKSINQQSAQKQNK